MTKDKYVDVMIITLIGMFIGVGIGTYYRSRMLVTVSACIFYAATALICIQLLMNTGGT